MTPIPSTTGNTSPGWYPDPKGRGQRYWNGQAWTRMRRPAARQSACAGGAWVGLTGRTSSTGGY